MLSHGFRELSKQILWISYWPYHTVSLVCCCSCWLFWLCSSRRAEIIQFILKSVPKIFLTKSRHGMHWLVFFWQGGTMRARRHLSDSSGFAPSALIAIKFPPRSDGIPENHLVTQGQPSDPAVEQSGDTISWHLREGCVGGLALGALIVMNFQTWVNPMVIWPSLFPAPAAPGEHSMFLN